MSNIKCPPGFRRSRAKGHHAGCVKKSHSRSKQSKKRSGKRSAKKSGKKSKKGSRSRSNIICPPGYRKTKGKGCQPK